MFGVSPVVPTQRRFGAETGRVGDDTSACSRDFRSTTRKPLLARSCDSTWREGEERVTEVRERGHLEAPLCETAADYVCACLRLDNYRQQCFLDTAGRLLHSSSLTPASLQLRFQKSSMSLSSLH